MLCGNCNKSIAEDGQVFTVGTVCECCEHDRKPVEFTLDDASSSF